MLTNRNRTLATTSCAACGKVRVFHWRQEWRVWTLISFDEVIDAQEGHAATVYQPTDRQLDELISALKMLGDLRETP